jgi:hypothetical protein
MAEEEVSVMARTCPAYRLLTALWHVEQARLCGKLASVDWMEL